MNDDLDDDAQALDDEMADAEAAYERDEREARERDEL